MKNKFKDHGFWKQRNLFLGYATEIYKMFLSTGHYVTKDNVAHQIIEQRRGYEHYSDCILNSIELDDSLVRDRDGSLSIFPEESTDRMDAGIMYDNEYLEGAAYNIAKLVVKIHKYICLCQQLGIDPVNGLTFGSNFC